MNKNKIWKNLLVGLIAAFIFLLILEAGARLFIYFIRGSSTVGTQERTLYLQYQPFVMFGPDWDKVLSPDKHKIDKGPSGAFRILLIGGSAAANFPAGILQETFCNKFPNHKFEVINAAMGGYNSRQELIVTAIRGPALKPDIIITLDGANDLIHRLRMDKAGTFYLNPTYKYFIEKPLFAPLVHIMTKSQLIQAAFRVKERMSVNRRIIT